MNKRSFWTVATMLALLFSGCGPSAKVEDSGVPTKGCITNVIVDGTTLLATAYIWRDFMPSDQPAPPNVRCVLEMQGLTQDQMQSFRPESFQAIVASDTGQRVWVEQSFVGKVEREGSLIRVNLPQGPVWEPDQDVVVYFRFYMGRSKPYCLKRKAKVQATH